MDQAERAAHTTWERGDLKQAFKQYLAIAKLGCDGAWINVGYFYDVGIGVKRNRKQALYWYRRAYRSGHSAAASNIATLYRDEGRSRLEVIWYKKSAALGDADAAVEVAKHYLSGTGVRKHRGHALAYLNRAIATPSPYITKASLNEARRILRKLQAPNRRANKPLNARPPAKLAAH